MIVFKCNVYRESPLRPSDIEHHNRLIRFPAWSFRLSQFPFHASSECRRGICFPDCLWLGIPELGGRVRKSSEIKLVFLNVFFSRTWKPYAWLQCSVKGLCRNISGGWGWGGVLRQDFWVPDLSVFTTMKEWAAWIYLHVLNNLARLAKMWLVPF